MGKSIVGLKSLIQGHRINNNNPTSKTGISGSLADRITKMLIYGKERKSETDLEIGKIKKALGEFPKQSKNKTRKIKAIRKQKKTNTRTNQNFERKMKHQ